ncbi:MAG: hypothetical protein KC619_25650 [Myxococcales bacterium]|nr:hypothetical protein [Myxococcales bacterium]
MTLQSLLEPYRDRLSVPERSEAEDQLHVTADYLEVHASGALGLDVAQDLPVDASLRDQVPFWARDVSILARATAVEREELPAVLDSVFYLVGATYGGGLLVQISRGARRGKLGTIPDSAIPSFELGEVPVPPSPIDDDHAADTYLEELQRGGGIRLHDLDLLGFLDLRLRSATRP